MIIYIDPGTGSLIVQALAAGVVSFLFYAKKIIRFFAPLKGGKPEQGLAHLLDEAAD